MIYIGNKPEGMAKAYKHRKYTHTNKRGTRFFDCWSYEDERRPNPDRLDKKLIVELETFITGRRRWRLKADNK